MSPTISSLLCFGRPHDTRVVAALPARLRLPRFERTAYPGVSSRVGMSCDAVVGARRTASAKTEVDAMKDPDAPAGSETPFTPVEITRRAAILVHADLDTVFPLFGPIRESDWADGWNPSILSRDVEPMREGCVFQTDHEGKCATWILAEYRREPRLVPEGVAEGAPTPETARVQYVVVSPESHVARIR